VAYTWRKYTTNVLESQIGKKMEKKVIKGYKEKKVEQRYAQMKRRDSSNEERRNKRKSSKDL
jgi:hypothetical protein